MNEDQKMNDEELMDLADLFKQFGDQTRLRIMMECQREEEISVGELSERLGMTPSAVSHQLAVLKSGKLLKARREGKQVFYSLADDHVRTIIAMGVEHIEEE